MYWTGWKMFKKQTESDKEWNIKNVLGNIDEEMRKIFKHIKDD